MVRRFQGLGQRAAELALAGLFAAIALLAIGDSLRIGAGWAEDGPRSGYFPFWVGVVLLVAAVAQLVSALGVRPREVFASREDLARVASVLAPAAVHVALIPALGLYLSSALLVAWFMARIGDFSWAAAILSGIAVAAVAFVVFELWFLVALPKGPVEEFLGY